MFEMSTAAEELLAQALKLAPEGREILAVQLIGSLEQPPCYAVDWDAEVRRRVEEADSGIVPGIPGETVMARLRTRVLKERL